MRWAMTTLNAVDCGARMEVGMLCCKFNSAHKIVGVELMFDVMVYAAAQASSGSDSFLSFQHCADVPKIIRQAHGYDADAP
jgi:hypothetical protein